MTEPLSYRSGAVARMLRMPVATLRIWERRYRICQPRLSPSGQRLYSAADVQRLGVIQQLVARGHAVGTLARLDMAALQAMAAHHAATLARPRDAAPAARLRVCVTDPALRTRWQQPLWRTLWPAAVLWVTDPDTADVRIDHPARLLPEDRLTPPPAGQRWGVVLRYAAAPAVAALQAAGAVVLREPADADALSAWLNALLPPAAEPPGHHPAPLTVDDAAACPAPRWDDATLQALAGLSTTVACECPRHLAELLIQLGQFEAYSAQCASRDAKDAALHRHLQRVSGQARLLLEDALARVAEAEGLLPGAAQAASAGVNR